MTPRWRGLRARLLVGHLVVAATGLLMVLLATQLFAPQFFAQQMMGSEGSRDMGELMRQMMGSTATPPGTMGSLDAVVLDAFRRSVAEGLALGALAAALVAVGASVLVSNRISTPIRHLVTASRRVAAGHYAERVPPDDLDEIGELARSFNAMASALEATERRRQELVGDVSHELRTPVATLEGYLEGLLDGVIEPSAPLWAKLHGEVGRLRRLIDDLEDLSRAEAGQTPLMLQAMDPTEIALAAADRLRGQFAEKALEFNADIPVGLPLVRADRDRAVQVLTNLLTNALRYTPAPGKVRLLVTPLGDAVQFAVEDTGIGVAQEDLLRVFERFYRVDKSRSRALGGSGVGLAIARALVDAMHGRIWAESPGLGRGSTFRFTLPRAH